mgnify:CR=1 FL=1
MTVIKQRILEFLIEKYSQDSLIDDVEKQLEITRSNNILMTGNSHDGKKPSRRAGSVIFDKVKEEGRINV